MNPRPSVISLIIFLFCFSVFAQNKVTKTFTVNGTTHSCNWYVPAGINKPPVVFFIHGANGSGNEFENTTKANPVADKEKFIAVYPAASSNGNAGIWADMSGTSNFPFFLAVLDTLDKRYQIDRNRVYMTGFSQGGFISFVAGCKYSDIFAAIAPVSGHAGSGCNLKRPVSVFLTFGAQEDKAAFVRDLDTWLQLDSCPPTPTITRPYSSSKPSSRVTRVAYGPCAQGTYVIMDSISGQGHQWPSTTNINQAEETWAFFKQFSLKSSTSAHKMIQTPAQQPVSASYVSGVIHLQGIKDKTRIQVVDTRGRLVTTAVAANQKVTVDNMPGGMYMLLMKVNTKPVSIKFVVP